MFQGGYDPQDIFNSQRILPDSQSSYPGPSPNPHYKAIVKVVEMKIQFLSGGIPEMKIMVTFVEIALFADVSRNTQVYLFHLRDKIAELKNLIPGPDRAA